MHPPVNQSPPAQITHGATSQSQDERASVTPAKPGKLLRLPIVEERTGLKKSTLYAQVKAGNLSPPVRLSARAVAWREEDIDRWISERVATGGQS